MRSVGGNKLAIIGASGFAREVADIALDLGFSEISFVANNETASTIFNFPVVEETADVINALHADNYFFAFGIGAPKTRKAIFDKYPHLIYPNLIHPSATFGHMQKALIDSQCGNVIAAGCRFTNNIKFGDFGLYNLNAMIGHDCEIGDFISIMPNVFISGNVKIEDEVFIGAGSTIIQGENDAKNIIGKNAIIGMGSVVIRKVLQNTKVVGNPAKEIN